MVFVVVGGFPNRVLTNMWSYGLNIVAKKLWLVLFGAFSIILIFSTEKSQSVMVYSTWKFQMKLSVLRFLLA